MRRSLQGKRVLITGASRGLGKALAEEAAQRGARLALAARSAKPLELLATQLRASGGDAVPIPADLTSVDDRRRLLDTVRDSLGGLDVLINNAGVGSFGHFAESTETILRQVMELNFFAPAELMRAAIPLLAYGQQPGIVNISSMCGRRGLPAWPEYSASKFALAGLSDAVRGELVRYGISVLLVLPGLTQTGLASHMLRNEGRMAIDFTGGMRPEYVARRILDALERNRREIVLGREAIWMLRINRLWPWLVDRLMQRKVRQLYAADLGETS
jgi:short-subunit dehydrogenase